MPKLSIISICFNNREGLQRTLESVFRQTFRDFELIVIDGGSTDGSAEFIRENKDKISFWVSEKDNGIYNAQNKGLDKATGEYCLFLNSGDYLVDEKVFENVFRNNPSDDIVYGNMIIRKPGGEERHGKMPTELSFHHMIADTLWHPVSFIRRELFKTIGKYDETLKMVADYDFFLKAIIVHEVKTKHCGITVAVFTLDGFSSDPKNLSIRNEERKLVQSRYFSKKVIESAKSLNIILQSPLYRLARFLKLV